VSSDAKKAMPDGHKTQGILDSMLIAAWVLCYAGLVIVFRMARAIEHLLAGRPAHAASSSGAAERDVAAK
jgi:hypothetical protein